MDFRKAWGMKWIVSRHIPETVGVALSIFAAYLISGLVVWLLLLPLQHAILPGMTSPVSLLFLPHGIRVLATSLLGRQAVPGLISAELASNYVFWNIADPATLFLASAVSGSATWFAFEGLRKLGIDAFYLRASTAPPPFNVVLLAAIAAAVINGFAITAILEGPGGEQSVTVMLAAIITGDVTGFLATVMLAKWSMPLLSRSRD